MGLASPAPSNQPSRRAWNLRNLDLYADRAPLGLRYNQVVVVLDVLDGRVVQTSSRQDAQGQRRREEVELAISEAAISTAVSRSPRGKSSGHNHLLFAQTCPTSLPK